MKKILIYSLTALSIIGAISVWYLINQGSAVSSISGPTEEFTKERLYWENQLHRDPKTGKIPKGIRIRENNFVSSLNNKFKSKSGNRLQSVNFWEQRGIYEVGGRTRALAFDIRNENTVIAAGVSGGIWRSTDAGLSWSKRSDPQQLQSVSCITQDVRPGHEDTWYCGTGELWGNSAAIQGDGIFKSTDNGLSWFSLPSTTTLTPESWDNKFDYCWKILMNPYAANDDGEVYVSTSLGGIYRSNDGGKIWKAVFGGQGNNFGRFIEIAQSPSGIFYAAVSNYYQNNTPSGIFRSINGTNWVNITPENFPAKYARIVIGIAPSDESQVYFVAETPEYGKWTTNSMGDDLWHSFWKYTYVTGDGAGSGGIWEDRSENLPRPDLVRGHMNSQSSYNLCIHVKPDDPNVVFLGATTLYRSKDGFKTSNWDWIGGTCPWNDCDYSYRYPNHHADNHTIVFSRTNPNIMYTGSDGGVHKTIDCMANTVEWISLNNGYFTTQFYSIEVDKGTPGSEYILGGLQDNGTLSQKTNSYAQKWDEPSRGDGFCCQVPDGNQCIYVSQNSSYQPKIKVFRAVQLPNGKNEVFTRIEPRGGKDFIWNTPFKLDPNNNNIMYLAGGNLVWRNNDLGSIPFVNTTDSITTNWDSLTYTRLNNFDQSQSRAEAVTALDISNAPANVLYFGTSYGRVFRVDKANQGQPESVEVTGMEFPKYGNVNCIAMNPEDASDVIVAFSNYSVVSLFRSTDSGKTWSQISGNLEESPNGFGAGPATHWVEMLKVNGKYLYLCGTSAGLFITAYLNGANTIWQQESPELIGNMVIMMIDTRQSDGFTAVSTHGNGVYTSYIKNLPAIPDQVNLIEPVNKTKGIQSKTLLTWEKSSITGYYNLQVSKDANFEQIILNTTIDTTISTIPDLEQGLKTYYWRVAAISAGGQSQFSQIWSFETACLAPELVFPENQTKDLDFSAVIMKWNQAEGAVKYHVQLSDKIGFNQLVMDDTVSTLQTIPIFLKASTRYFWRVATIGEGGEGVFSKQFAFVTAASTGVIGNSGLSTSLFPNPANEYVNLKFSNKNAQIVGINLYDFTGKLVAGEGYRFYYTGEYSIKMNLKNLPSGSYYFKIEYGNDYIENQLLIIKK